MNTTTTAETTNPAAQVPADEQADALVAQSVAMRGCVAAPYHREIAHYLHSTIGRLASTLGPTEAEFIGRTPKGGRWHIILQG